MPRNQTVPFESHADPSATLRTKMHVVHNASVLKGQAQLECVCYVCHLEECCADGG